MAMCGTTACQLGAQHGPTSSRVAPWPNCQLCLPCRALVGVEDADPAAIRCTQPLISATTCLLVGCRMHLYEDFML